LISKKNSENHATLDDMELSRKKSLTFYVAAKMGRSANGEIRESDAIAIETPFRLCNWVEEEARLSCTGKEGLRSRGEGKVHSKKIISTLQV